MKYKLAEYFSIAGVKDEEEYRQLYEIASNREVGDDIIKLNGAIFRICTYGLKKDKAKGIAPVEESIERKLSRVSGFEDIQEFKTISERSGFLIDDDFYKHSGGNGESRVIIRKITKPKDFLCEEIPYGKPATHIKPIPRDVFKIYNNDTNPTNFVEVKDVDLFIVCKNKLYVIIGGKV